MKRWLVRLLSGLVMAAIVIVILAWLTVRASLPQLDGEIPVSGIEAEISIERDAAGIPTITASNRADAAFATGFVHGQDRFFQMDMIRRDAAGELSAIIGPATLAVDRTRRLHRFRSRARTAIDVMSAAERQLLERYAAGVNAGLASLGAKPFEYYVLNVEPQPWRAEDSMLVAYAMFINLNDERAVRDVRRGLAAEVLPDAVYAWLYPRGTPWDAPLMGDARELVPIPAASVYSLRDAESSAPPSHETGKPFLNGSNNWAVSGSLTDTGRALVANDMHLGLDVPNIYYRARLIVAGDSPMDATGVTLPGQPLLIAGSNGRVAWGFTNSHGDWSDAVALKAGGAAATYRTPAGELPFERHEELIRIKGGDPEKLLIRETIWGPVDENSEHPGDEIAVSWIAHATDAVNIRLMDLERARDVEEALDIANTAVMPPQNFVVGDAEGNIGWTIAGRIPVRGDYDPMLPADWSEIEGWRGWLRPEDYPRVVNPPSGRIWTANSRVADGEALRIIGDGGYDLGARATQIRDALFAQERFEPADMLAIQYDDRALFLSRWQALLLELIDQDAIEAHPELRDYRELVANWLPRASPESVGYRLVRGFRLEAERRVFHALTGPLRTRYGEDVRLRISNQFEAPLWTVLNEQPEHLLPANYDSWRQFMLEAVRANIAYYRSHFSGPLADRTWGEINTATIRHPFSPGIPLLSRWLDMPRDPLNGDVDMPKAQGPTFGASERFAVYPGDEAASLMHLPGGQSGHPLSEFYKSGHRDWVEGRPSPFLPGETRHRLILRAATR